MPQSNSQAALEAVGLSKRFGDFEAVSDVSFEVRRGRAFGLLGPNGSGKTTSVRLLNGVLSPSAGSVQLFGEGERSSTSPNSSFSTSRPRAWTPRLRSNSSSICSR